MLDSKDIQPAQPEQKDNFSVLSTIAHGLSPQDRSWLFYSVNELLHSSFWSKETLEQVHRAPDLQTKSMEDGWKKLDSRIKETGIDPEQPFYVDRQHYIDAKDKLNELSKMWGLIGPLESRLRIQEHDSQSVKTIYGVAERGSLPVDVARKLFVSEEIKSGLTAKYDHISAQLPPHRLYAHVTLEGGYLLILDWSVPKQIIPSSIDGLWFMGDLNKDKKLGVFVEERVLHRLSDEAKHWPSGYRDYGEKEILEAIEKTVPDGQLDNDFTPFGNLFGSNGAAGEVAADMRKLLGLEPTINDPADVRVLHLREKIKKVISGKRAKAETSVFCPVEKVKFSHSEIDELYEELSQLSDYAINSPIGKAHLFRTIKSSHHDLNKIIEAEATKIRRKKLQPSLDLEKDAAIAQLGIARLTNSPNYEFDMNEVRKKSIEDAKTLLATKALLSFNVAAHVLKKLQENGGVLTSDLAANLCGSLFNLARAVKAT